MKLKKILSEISEKDLKNLNKSTWPKIPTEKIYKHKVSVLPTDQTKLAYEQLESDNFKNLPVEIVNVNDIVPTQKVVTFDNLKKVSNVNQNTGAFLFKMDDKYYVLDGHHRIAVNILNDKNTIKAHIFEI